MFYILMKLVRLYFFKLIGNMLNAVVKAVYKDLWP